MSKTDLYTALKPSSTNLTDAEELLVLCARMNFKGSLVARSDAIISSGRIDWRRFKELAGINQVIPLVYRNLQLFREVPDEVMQFLREGAGHTLARNMKIKEDVKILSDGFNKEGAETLFVKGVPFMMDTYRDFALRTFADVDIIVREPEAAVSVLKKAGYRPLDGSLEFDNYRSQKVFVNDRGTYIDVHSDFIGRHLHNSLLKIDHDRIWRDKRDVEFEDIKIHTMDYKHTLLYHSIHLSMHHSFFGLRWYVDMNEFIERHKDNIHWGEALRLANEYKIRRPLYYTLRFTRNMFDTPVPLVVLDNLKDVERGFDRWIFKKVRASNGDTDYLAELAMFDRMMDSFKFLILSLINHPRHILHFTKIFGRLVRQVLGGIKKEV
ncbi:MAG: nucleotidyltransferase family protein [Candidatus Omnitrophica bacterium]|nr:nucleotidyltransferase family protein [Candidatus Omnitrophota bacterium]